MRLFGVAHVCLLAVMRLFGVAHVCLLAVMRLFGVAHVCAPTVLRSRLCTHSIRCHLDCSPGPAGLAAWLSGQERDAYQEASAYKHARRCPPCGHSAPAGSATSSGPAPGPAPLGLLPLPPPPTLRLLCPANAVLLLLLLLRRATEFRLHFDPAEPHPTDGWPGNKWIYQNTYVDMTSLGPVIDEAMRRAGIPPMAAQQQRPDAGRQEALQ